jgi:hypothetical protein
MSYLSLDTVVFDEINSHRFTQLIYSVSRKEWKRYSKLQGQARYKANEEVLKYFLRCQNVRENPQEDNLRVILDSVIEEFAFGQAETSQPEICSKEIYMTNERGQKASAFKAVISEKYNGVIPPYSSTLYPDILAAMREKGVEISKPTLQAMVSAARSKANNNGTTKPITNGNGHAIKDSRMQIVASEASERSSLVQLNGQQSISEPVIDSNFTEGTGHMLVEFVSLLEDPEVKEFLKLCESPKVQRFRWLFRTEPSKLRTALMTVQAYGLGNDVQLQGAD